MALFFKKSSHQENRIENAGRWPLRLTVFHLVDDYEFPPSQFIETFYVREGNFLHETDAGTQALRKGAVIVNHPSNRHTIKQPEHVRIVRLRFLPEWLARDYDTILESPDVLSLFFAQSWFDIPSETTLNVFTTREAMQPFVEMEFDLLQQNLATGRQTESITRIGLLKLMLMLGDEYSVYWRGANRIEIPSQVRQAFDMIEKAVLSGDSLRLKDLEPAVGVSQDHLGRLFRKATGVTLVDYAQLRRIHHAALRLLTTDIMAKDISEALGFTDSAHFSKSFQKYFGVSPNVYRQKFGPPEASPEPPEKSPDQQG